MTQPIVPIFVPKPNDPFIVDGDLLVLGDEVIDGNLLVKGIFTTEQGSIGSISSNSLTVSGNTNLPAIYSTTVTLTPRYVIIDSNGKLGSSAT